MLPSQMRHEPLNQLVPLVEFSFDSPRGQKTVANESWVLVCRCELASSGGSNRAIEQRSRTIRWRQGTITVVSSRPHTVSEIDRYALALDEAALLQAAVKSTQTICEH